MSKVVVIVQARMGSTRLPGKHMKEVLGKPLLAYLIERLQNVKEADQVVIATTKNIKDDVLVDFCRSQNVSVFRGDEEDVLDRYLQAAITFQADIIVRVCADCPLIDPSIIDKAIHLFHSSGFDLVTNAKERTFPRGMDVEVFSFQALKNAAGHAKLTEEREHVTPYFYKHPDVFKIYSLIHSTDQSLYRWTVDTEKDLELISHLIETLYPQKKDFNLEDLLCLIKTNPHWSGINQEVQQKAVSIMPEVLLDLQIVRPVEEDVKQVFKWRNDPQTLKMSFHSQPKVWESYFFSFLKESYCFPDLPPLFVLNREVRIAFLSLSPIASPQNKSRKCCKLSINLAPEHRGKGLGKHCLLLAREFAKQQGYDEIYAEIKKTNSASKKAFEEAGFQSIGDFEKIVFDTGEKVPIYRYLVSLTSRESYAMQQVYIIAEIGSNWRIGHDVPDFNIAKKMIEAAALAGANAVKFQIFNPETLYVSNAGQSHYLAAAGIKDDIQDLFNHVVVPHEMIPQLSEWSQANGLDFIATAFSPKDFAAIDPYVAKHKIASYEIGHTHLIELAARSGKPLLMSTGAATEEEIAWAVETFQRAGGQDLTLLQCTARYPAEPSGMNLRVIPWLMHRFQLSAGLSDHSPDPIAAPASAVALGATVIEKHMTLNKSFEGPDHAFALTPEEFFQMVAEIRKIEPMLGLGVKAVHESEQELRAFARRGIQALKEIQKGDAFKEGDNIAILRPGNQPLGVHPLFLPTICGKKAVRSISKGTGIQFEDFS